jgi:hypothetical protein
MASSAAERGRLGAHVSWARTADRAARTWPQLLAPVPPPRDPANSERPRVRLADPVPVADALEEYVRQLVDQAPELSPRISEKLTRIISGHHH